MASAPMRRATRSTSVKRTRISAFHWNSSKSRQFIFMEIDRVRASEVRYLPADRPTDEFKIMQPRRQCSIMRTTSRQFFHPHQYSMRRTTASSPRTGDAGCGAWTRADCATTTRPASLALRNVRQFHVAIDVDRDGNSVIRASAVQSRDRRCLLQRDRRRLNLFLRRHGGNGVRRRMCCDSVFTHHCSRRHL